MGSRAACCRTATPGFGGLRRSAPHGRRARPLPVGQVLSFPPAGEGVPVEVTKTVTPKGETWQWRFGTRVFRSHLSASARDMTESFGPFTFLLGLKVQEEALHYPVMSGRLGPLPLPRWLLPGSVAQEHARDGRFHFDVKILAPVAGTLLVHYRGFLEEVTGSRVAAYVHPTSK
nr:DUF4166 domain-containing protein [Paracoccus sp. (in: a-proteobacteria)]